MLNFKKKNYQYLLKKKIVKPEKQNKILKHFSNLHVPKNLLVTC